MNNYPNLKKVIINDINEDLTDTYKSIKNNVNELIDILQVWEREYHNLLENETSKKEYYYQKRELFNQRISNKIEQSALFIFLNKTLYIEKKEGKNPLLHLYI